MHARFGWFGLLVLVLALAGCGEDDAASSAGGGGGGEGPAGPGATTSTGPASSGSVGGGGAAGPGGAGGGGATGGGGSGGSSPRTGPDATYAKAFGGGDVCHRHLTRVVAAPDGWVIAGRVGVVDGFESEPCSIQIGGTTITPPGVAQWSVSFVAKLAADATAEWVVPYTLTKNDPAAVRDLAVDSMGATHVIGESTSGFTVGAFEALAGNYLLTIDPAGTPVTLVQTTIPPLPQELVIDASDNLYYGSSGKVTKYSPLGAELGSTPYDFGGVTGDLMASMVVDGMGQVFFVGPAAPQGGFDVGLAKLSADLTPAWSTTFGGPNQQTGFGLAPDGSGGVVLIGTFDTSAALGGAPLTGAVGEVNGFVAGFDAAGAHQYSSAFGSAVLHDCCEGPKIAAAPGGDVVVAGGATAGSIDFGQGPIAVPPADAAFLARLTASGAPKWVRTFGPGARATDVAVAADGTIAIVGTFGGPIDFGTGPLPASPAYDDGFIAIFPAE